MSTTTTTIETTTVSTMAGVNDHYDDCDGVVEDGDVDGNHDD